MKTSKKKWIVPLCILFAVAVATTTFLNRRGTTDIVIDMSIERIAVTSSAFREMEAIPDKYTGRGEDVSPDFILSELSDKAVSIAIIMDDLDVPWKSNFTHWVIWNIPARTVIPEAIPHGDTVSSLESARQGVAFGENRYRGPMPPFGTHRYQYHVFVLDSLLNLDATADKAALLASMDGHILQYGSIVGWYPHVD
jgi:Raf kinase inhibitor-like YbhB/YbcL family protein